MLNTHYFPNILLPENKIVDFSKPGESVKILNTLTGMYGLAICALKTLKKGELTAFDSLATDCSCHLRALKIASLAQELFASQSDLLTELNKTVELLELKKAVLQTAAKDLEGSFQKGKKMNSPLSPIVLSLQTLQKESNSSSCSIAIQDVLSQLKAKDGISEDLAYAIHAYILTTVKGQREVTEKDKIECSDQKCKKTLSLGDGIFKETTYPKKLSELLKKQESNKNISLNLIEKEVYKLAKKHLAEISVEFLLKETKKLENQPIFTFLNSSQKLVEGKVEIPDFYSVTGAFQVCLQKKMPVLLKIKKCSHSHRYQEPKTPFDLILYLFPQEGKFEVKPLDKNAPNVPIIVVEGKRSGNEVEEESTHEYEKRLMKDFDFLHFCALDGAQHKQYTSDEDSMDQKPSEVIPPLKEKKFEFEAKKIDSLKEEAQEKGCSFHNQSLLILSHIFADMLDEQKKEMGLSPKIANGIEKNMNDKENK